MTMAIDEIEHYQKLLEEWNWSASPNTPKTPPSAAPRSASSPAPQPAKPAGPRPAVNYQPGAVLTLGGRSVVIYKSPAPDKGYHLALVLLPNHAVKTQGVALDRFQCEELGCLSPELFDRVQREMRWSRDLLVFHCYSYEDVEKLPEQIASPAAPDHAPSAPAADPIGQATASSSAGRTEPARPPQQSRPEPPPGPGGLRRGQQLQVRFGDKAWYAVYWGRDEEGPVVAHRTNHDWSLMHLDLDRFGTDLVIDPNPSPELVAEIEASLTSA